MRIEGHLGALLELEARNSNRTIEEHIGHVLSRRYAELRRICECGFFVYLPSDDLTCSECGRKVCPHCTVPEGADDVCVAHRPGKTGGGFRR